MSQEICCNSIKKNCLTYEAGGVALLLQPLSEGGFGGHQTPRAPEEQQHLHAAFPGHP